MSNGNEHHEAGERQHSLAHDLRHALFALRTGINLLAQVRMDAGRFNEVQELLQKEVCTASELLNELLDEGD